MYSSVFYVTITGERHLLPKVNIAILMQRSKERVKSESLTIYIGISMSITEASQLSKLQLLLQTPLIISVTFVIVS